MTRELTMDELRAAFLELLGAERRLRGRDQHRTGGLSHNHVRALAQLEDADTSAGCLARTAELSPAAMTAMLDQLEHDGMVTRRRSSEDRRQVIVSLTDDGRAKLATKRAMWQEAWHELLAHHSEDELQAAMRVMHDIAGLLDRLSRTPAPAEPSEPAAAA